MALFLNWLIIRDAATLLRLGCSNTPSSSDPQDYNPLFDSELEKVIARIHDPDLRRQVSELKGFDWANYIVRSLQRSGFNDDDHSGAFHEIVVKLLVEPGQTVCPVGSRKHGPLDRRFRRSVWNAIRNAEKTRNRRRWMTSHDPSIMAGQYAGRAPYSDLIDQFRNLVAQRLGKLALEILDARLAGEDSKKLVGKAANGTASAYYIRRETSALKRLAHQFAAQSGDPGFMRLVDRAFDAEAATVAKRHAARIGK